MWWNANLAGEYNKDVAGIAKDDSSDLAQIKSRSSNPNSIVTITAEDKVNGLEDGEALIWSNQDQTTSKNILQLDGVNDYLAIADSDAIDFSPDQDFTVEVKVKTDGSTANDAIIEKWSQSGGYPFVIRYREDGTIQAARYDGSNNPAVKSSTKINDGELHHIAFVKEGIELKLYIDGNLENANTDTTTGTTTNNSPLYLGSRGGNKEFFNGNIDDLRIWNVARSATEIKNNRNSTDSNNNDLVAYLSLENDANDLTGNGNNGTFHNEASIATIEAIDLTQRIWQVQEKQGDVGEVSVSFDLSNLGQQLPLENYALQIADNDNFDNAKFHTIGSKIENNTLTFTGVDFQDAEYFTLDTEYDPSLYSQHIGEIGKISNLDHLNQTIQLNNNYENSIVFTLPLSYNGGDPAIARITEIQDDNFSVYVQEAEYKDGSHAKESLSYLVLEAGTWELADGTMLEVGSIDTKSTTTSSWKSIDFATDFQQTPAILSQVQTQNEL